MGKGLCLLLRTPANKLVYTPYITLLTRVTRSVDLLINPFAAHRSLMALRSCRSSCVSLSWHTWSSCGVNQAARKWLYDVVCLWLTLQHRTLCGVNACNMHVFPCSKCMLEKNACSKFMLGENAFSKFMLGENACSKFMLGENACSIQKASILQSYPPTTENQQKLRENCCCLMSVAKNMGKVKKHPIFLRFLLLSPFWSILWNCGCA